MGLWEGGKSGPGGQRCKGRVCQGEVAIKVEEEAEVGGWGGGERLRGEVRGLVGLGRGGSWERWRSRWRRRRR